MTAVGDLLSRETRARLLERLDELDELDREMHGPVCCRARLAAAAAAPHKQPQRHREDQAVTLTKRPPSEP